MARIDTYANDANITGQERLISSDTDANGTTKNIVVDKLGEFISSSYSGRFLGTFTSLAQLQADHPTPPVGFTAAFAYVDAGVGTTIVEYLWDNSDNQWVIPPATADFSTLTGMLSNSQVPDNELTTTKIQQIAATRLLGNASGVVANVDQLTPVAVRTMLNVEDGATADQTASEVPSTAVGNISATNVQSAIQELDSEKAGVSLSNTFSLAQIMGNALVAGSSGIYQGVNEGVSGRRWFYQKDQSTDDFLFLYQNTAETTYATGYTTLYSLDSSGTPVNPTDLVTRAYGDANYAGGGTDPNAIHDNVAAEISAITEKTTPVNADLLLIEDSADSNNKKRIQIANLPGISELSTIIRSTSNLGLDNALLRSDGLNRNVQASTVTLDDSQNMAGLNSLRFTVTDTPPNPNEGRLYANDTANRLQYYDGTSFKNLLLEGDAAGASLPVDDTTSLVQDPTDNTRQVRIDAGTVGTGQTRVLTMPDADIDLSVLRSTSNGLLGNNTGAEADLSFLTTIQVRSLLSINNTNNTSDLDKPVSIAQQAAIDNAASSLVRQELTADYTATINDNGKLFFNTSANDYVFTIPNQANVAYTQDVAFTFAQYGTGKIQVNKETGVTADTNESTTQEVPFSLLRFGADNWRYLGSDGSYVSFTPPSPSQQVVYLGQGDLAVQAGGSSVTANLPSGINADDFLLLQVATGANATIETPTGWTLIYEQSGTDAGTSATFTIASYYRYGVQDETGTVITSITGGTASVSTARISRYDHVKLTGTPYENLTTTGPDLYDTTLATGTGIPVAALSAGTTNLSLAVTLIYFDDTRAIDQDLQFYIQNYFSGTSTGSDQALGLYTLPLATPVPVLADAIYFDQTSKDGASVSFILLPE